MKSTFTLAKPVSSELHVWTVPTESNEEDVLKCLSNAEIERLALQPRLKRQEFAVSHAAVRQLLAGYLGVCPLDVPLTSDYGRPLAVPGLSLSLSHSGRLGLLAVSEGPVGVDLESLDNGHDEDLDEIAEATLTDAELRLFREAPVERRASSWLRSWVRKEALLKAHGQGISDRFPSEIDVTFDQQGEVVLRDLELGHEYVAAVATPVPTAAPTIREWRNDSV